MHAKWKGSRRVFALAILMLIAFGGTAKAGECEAKVGAWYVSSPQDIDDLEKIGFNLFYYALPNFDTMSPVQRTAFIEEGVNALGTCSQLILGIDIFLDRGWFHADGMEAFVTQWGHHPKIYGFLLKDDVMTSAFPAEGNVDPAALWIYRWYYRMIRNTAEGQSNSQGTDLAPGKKVIVTLPFLLINDAGHEVTNPISDKHFVVRSEYQVPPNFLTPGDAWDVVMPYWYPHRRQISDENEAYIIDVLYEEMAQLFPANAMIPILQVVSEEPSGLYSLEAQYDLSIQYQSLLDKGVVSSANKAIFYYTANGHAGVCENLLHRQCVRDASASNIYYREAEKLNAYHRLLHAD